LRYKEIVARERALPMTGKIPVLQFDIPSSENGKTGYALSVT